MWVMMHHLFIYSSLGIDLQGSSLMPLFFLLSGYTLTVTSSKVSGEDLPSSYVRVAAAETDTQITEGLIVDHRGDSVSAASSAEFDHANEPVMATESRYVQDFRCDMEENDMTVVASSVHGTTNGTETLLHAPSSSSSSSSSVGLAVDRSPRDQFRHNLRFWNNRFVRVYPLYLLTSLLALPFWLYGYGDVSPLNIPAIIVTSITTVLTLNSSLLFLLGGSLSGPGWTVGTLMVHDIPFQYCSYQTHTHMHDRHRHRHRHTLTTDIYIHTYTYSTTYAHSFSRDN